MTTTWQKVTVITLGAAILGGSLYLVRQIYRQEFGWGRGPAAVPQRKWVHPNVARLEEARKLVEEEKLAEARDLITRALTVWPESPVTTGLRDLLGEINTRLFFSKTPTVRKTEYVVRRGDALGRIARRLQSSTDLIMRTNEMTSTLLRPGDQLLVPSIDFTITVDLPRERIVVHDSRGFFTQYPIVMAELPPSRRSRQETRVRARSYWKEGERVRPRPGNPQAAATWIHLGNAAYTLYGVDEADVPGEVEIRIAEAGDTPAEEEQRPRTGIALRLADIEELSLLIKRGTPVTIIREDE